MLACVAATTAALNILALDQGKELAQYPECKWGGRCVCGGGGRIPGGIAPALDAGWVAAPPPALPSRHMPPTRLVGPRPQASWALLAPLP